MQEGEKEDEEVGGYLTVSAKEKGKEVVDEVGILGEEAGESGE